MYTQSTLSPTRRENVEVMGIARPVTDRSCEASEMLRNLSPLGREDVRGWMESRRREGFLLAKGK